MPPDLLVPRETHQFAEVLWHQVDVMRRNEIAGLSGNVSGFHTGRPAVPDHDLPVDQDQPGPYSCPTSSGQVLWTVDPAGTSRNIVDGIVRSVAQPDEFTAQEVDLWSTSHVFRAGHRIRVHVTSSHFPRWARNFNTGEPIEDGIRTRTAQQQIAHDAARPSRIILPVIPQES